MRQIWNTLAIGALAIPLGYPAQAADVRQVPTMARPLLDNAPLFVDEFASGWYLRGDIGYRKNNIGDAINVETPFLTNPDFDKAGVVGFGIGHKLDWLRADLTIDYGNKVKFTGDSALQADDFTAKVDSYTGMANIYADLGTWFGLSPYIGAGVGVAHLRASAFNVVSQGSGDTAPGEKWNFAWAYMAGLSYRVSGNTHIDIGYRHVDMGDVITGFNEAGNRTTLKKISADEIRVGVRYTLD